MDVSSLLLTVTTIYLALIAYGVVGARRRLAGRPRLVAESLMVLLPPLLMAGALAATGEQALVQAWWRLFALMIVAGAAVATVAEQVARRVDR